LIADEDESGLNVARYLLAGFYADRIDAIAQANGQCLTRAIASSSLSTESRSATGPKNSSLKAGYSGAIFGKRIYHLWTAMLDEDQSHSLVAGLFLCSL
jgi:hypothetical protein